MKAVMVMYDSLDRNFLSPYGCDWTHTPNYDRLSEKATRFDNFYVGSMPCMPARRELHPGRYNFLHRGWGPLEPFDDSMPELLKKSGIYTHLCTDHYHYWQDGGATRFSLTPERFASFYMQLFRLWSADFEKGRYRRVKLFDDLVNLLADGSQNACALPDSACPRLWWRPTAVRTPATSMRWMNIGSAIWQMSRSTRFMRKLPWQRFARVQPRRSSCAKAAPTLLSAAVSVPACAVRFAERRMQRNADISAL